MLSLLGMATSVQLDLLLSWDNPVQTRLQRFTNTLCVAQLGAAAGGTGGRGRGRGGAA